MDLRDKLIALLEPEIEGMGYELVEIQAKGRGGSGLVRIFIDHEDGIGLGDCEKVSRRVSALLDVEDPIKGAYELEVSSPGFDRPLRTLAHYHQYTGEQVKVQLVRALEGRRRFKGLLRGVDNDTLQIEVDGVMQAIPLDQVEWAQLAPDV